MSVTTEAGLFALALAVALGVIPGGAGGRAMAQEQPSLTTSSRLLKLGESITLHLSAPAGVEAGELVVFPRYLEQALPGDAFVAGGDLAWLEALPRQALPVALDGGRAEVSYTPERPGSYLARWTVAGEALYRYFAAVDDSYAVLRFSAFEGLEPNPTLHATGIPLDYRLPADNLVPGNPLLETLSSYVRRYGDQAIPCLPDTPEASDEERQAHCGAILDRVRELLPDPDCARSARLEMHHPLDPGYTRALTALGVNDHCGLWEANAPPWLGMPEFPYFASPVDCRKMNQDPGGSVVAHQWDFCAGWHFIGPVSWHYKAAEGEWAPAERCVRQGLEELVNAAQLSGHPVFAVPLYDGLVGPGYPNPPFTYNVSDSRAFAGSVSQVFVCGRALSAEEVRAVMRGGVGAVPDAAGAWSLSEGEGTGVSGTGPDGTLVGSAAWGEGPAGAAVTLDGTGGCVRMEGPLPLSGTDFSMGCWVRPAAHQRPWANLLSCHNDLLGRERRGIALEQDGTGANRFYLIGGLGNDWAGTQITTQLRPEVWQHFVVVRQGSHLVHYLDGVPVAEGEVGDAPFLPATDVLRIGEWARGDVPSDSDMLRFVERYQRLIAFDFPQRYPVVFARSVDIADYYRRHFAATPRTVFVSRTDHPLYDMWWLCTWCSEFVLVPRERIPWQTRMSSVMAARRERTPLKDPLSQEYVLVENQRRALRFERECPNPVWWFDYTRQETGPQGSAITWTETPDVTVLRTPWAREGGRLSTTLTMQTEARVADYAICLWELPAEADLAAPIETNAQEAIVARNLQGEAHLVLCFDLAPGAEVRVSLSAAQ